MTPSPATTHRRPGARYVAEFSAAWPPRPVALQCNLCVDAFRADNGATLHVPRSHARNRWPDADPAGSEPFLASAGSAVLYDSRTWHRRPDESNASGEPRTNVLHAISHAWMRPMIDAADEAARFVASAAFRALPARAAADAAALFGAAAPGACDGEGDGDDSDIPIEELDMADSDDDDDSGGGDSYSLQRSSVIFATDLRIGNVVVVDAPTVCEPDTPVDSAEPVEPVTDDAAESQISAVMDSDYAALEVDAAREHGHDAVIAWDGVRVVAGRKTILDDAHGVACAGRVTALMGPSGAGKTTLLNALSERVPLAAGAIAVAGAPTVAYLQQDEVFLSELSAREHVTFVAALRVAGVAARLVGTPAWRGDPKNGNHNWVEVYRGGDWAFIEARPAGGGETLDDPCDKWFCDPAHFPADPANRTSVFAARFDRHANESVYPMAWDPPNRDVPGVDRTADYFAACSQCA